MTNLSLWANKFEPVLFLYLATSERKSLGFSGGVGWRGRYWGGARLRDYAYSKHEELDHTYTTRTTSVTLYGLSQYQENTGLDHRLKTIPLAAGWAGDGTYLFCKCCVCKKGGGATS